jgi:hypothetical protein
LSLELYVSTLFVSSWLDVISTMVEFWDAGECGAGVKVGKALAKTGDSYIQLLSSL